MSKAAESRWARSPARSSCMALGLQYWLALSALEKSGQDLIVRVKFIRELISALVAGSVYNTHPLRP